MRPFFPLLAGWIAALALAAPAGAAADTLADIAREKALRVCIWPDYFGISYRNPRTLELQGIDVEMARELAGELGVQPVFVDSSFVRLIPDIESGRCHVAMFAIGITPARAEHLRFTEPHLVSDIYAVASATNQRVREWADIDQPGVVVAVARGTYHEDVMRARLKSARLVVLDTPHAREQEVASGRADVFMTDYPFSRRMLANAPGMRLIAPPAPYHLTRYAYALRPGDDAWHARVEAFVAAVKRDGRLLAAARKYDLVPIVAPAAAKAAE